MNFFSVCTTGTICHWGNNCRICPVSRMTSTKTEQWIAAVKPKAYQQAGRYLRKAAGVMKKQGKQEEWQKYLQNLRKKHARKTRLMEVLDSLEGVPVIKKQGR